MSERPKHYKKTGIQAPSNSKEYQRAYYEQNRDHLAALQRESRRRKIASMTPEEREAFRERERLKDASKPSAMKRRYRQAARENRKALLATPEGRAAWLEKKRTENWALGLRMQVKKRARNAHITLDPAITTEWIRAQFERQAGRCFYTGIPFVIESTKRGMRRPSLDRIESSVGYTPWNTVLCLCSVNYMKNDYDAADFLDLLEDIRRNRP